MNVWVLREKSVSVLNVDEESRLRVKYVSIDLAFRRQCAPRAAVIFAVRPDITLRAITLNCSAEGKEFRTYNKRRVESGPEF
jgi:hypothetical protein